MSEEEPATVKEKSALLVVNSCRLHCSINRSFSGDGITSILNNQPNYLTGLLECD